MSKWPVGALSKILTDVLVLRTTLRLKQKRFILLVMMGISEPSNQTSRYLIIRANTVIFPEIRRDSFGEFKLEMSYHFWDLVPQRVSQNQEKLL